MTKTFVSPSSGLSPEMRSTMAESATTMMRGVRALVESGDPEAVALFERALDIGLEASEGIQAAKLAADRGYVELGMALLARMVEIKPDDVDLLVEFASILLIARRPVDAAQVATNAATLYVAGISGEWMTETQQARLSEIYCVLGEALRLAAQDEDAVAVLTEAFQLHPGNGRVAAVLAETLVGLDRDQEAVDVCRHAHANGALSADLAYRLGKALLKLGCKDEARDAFQDALLLAPRNEQFALMVSATTEGHDTALPIWRVEKLFDQLAEHYDEMVLHGASYRVPGLIFRAIERHFPHKQWERALDLGCGTGLVGLLLQERCNAIRGVDVSDAMIRVARERGAYTDLVKGDFREFLKGGGGTCDLIVAADSLVYMGRLEETLGLIADTLDKEGTFIFSLNLLSNGRDWELQSSGRFAHSRPYVEAALAKAGLSIRECLEDYLMVETQGPVRGLLFLASRT